MWLRCATIIAASASVVCATNAALSQAPSLSDIVVEAFRGHCVRNMPRLDKIRAASRVLGWQILSTDQLTMIGPVDPKAESEGWLVGESGTRYLIGISTGRIGDQPVATCTIGSVDTQQSSVRTSLMQKLKLAQLRDETEAGQRYQYWTTELNGYSVLISLTGPQNESSSGMSLSAAVKLR